ncbi:MAG: response regulator transcription factor [Clostridia bacterium]|nr:response regulator transcription factor [Clostridia bacterium]
MKKILVVEDDNDIHKLIKELLEKEHYIVKSAYSGTEALTIIKNNNIDLILLDLMLPGINGEDIVKKVNKTIPIIVISAKTSSTDKVKVLLDGANDYITKPFEKIELLARIQVQLRMSHEQDKNLKYKDIELLEDNKTMKIQSHQITLTRTEYTIMRELLLNPNKVVTKNRLLDLITTDAENCDESSLKVHISNIRKKIRKITLEEYIEAVWGIGFKMKQ